MPKVSHFRRLDGVINVSWTLRKLPIYSEKFAFILVTLRTLISLDLAACLLWIVSSVRVSVSRGIKPLLETGCCAKPRPPDFFSQKVCSGTYMCFTNFKRVFWWFTSAYWYWILKLYLVTFNACMVVFINRTVQYTTQKCLKKWTHQSKSKL